MSIAVFSNELFNEINVICKDKNYIEILDILDKGVSGESNKDLKEKTLEINQREAQLIADVAIVEHIQAGLIYPYWSDDHAKYDELHESEFFEVQSFLQSVLFCLNGFDINTQGSSS